MSFTFILGCCSVLLVSLQGVRCLICEDSDVSNVIRFPIHPLKISDLLGRVIPPGQDQSPRYYEIYSFDFPNQTLPLPLLRKVSIRWKISQGFQFTNDFAGWLPPPYSLNDDGICESDNILFDKIMDRPYQDTWMFNFSVIFPEDEEYVGVSFSSYPERYLINWYCSRKYLQM